MTLGTSLRNVREQRGMSLVDVRDELLFTIPRRFVPSAATMSRIETGKVSDRKVDTIVVYGLAKVLGCRISELSEEVAQELDAMRDLLEQSSPCIAALVPGQGSLFGAVAA